MLSIASKLQITIQMTFCLTVSGEVTSSCSTTPLPGQDDRITSETERVQPSVELPEGNIIKSL